MNTRCTEHVFITTAIDYENNNEKIETCTNCGQVRIIRPGEDQPLHSRLGRPLRQPKPSRRGD